MVRKLMTLFHSASSPCAHGIDMNTCRTICTMDLNSVNGMTVCVWADALTHLCRIARRNSLFGSSNCIVFSPGLPLKVKPSKSLLTAH